MCTVSWCRQPEGYTLFFNRDESRARTKGIPPKESVIGDTQCLHPTDPTGQGTWLLVNQHGLTFGLLNYYEAQLYYQPVDRQSRGRLPLDLAECRKLTQVSQTLGTRDLSPFPPFHFLSLDSDGQANLLTWNGKSKSTSHPSWKDLPLSTSSFETSRVIAARKAEFSKTVHPAPDRLAAMDTFHTSERPSPPTFSALMNRPDAKTVSVTRIDVTSTEVRMSYRDRPDDSAQLSDSVTISLDRA